MNELPNKVVEFLSAFQKAGFECYAVGGPVRDLLLGRPQKDWDFTTNATPDQIIELFPDSFYNNNFGTVGIKIRDEKGETEEVFEITPFRKEGTYSDQRHPDKIEWAKTVEEDLSRRDFTINSIAVTSDHRPASRQGGLPSSDYRIVDPFNGREDLKNKVIRSVGNPDNRFQEDGLRLMRAIRLATQLAFQIEVETWKAIQKNASLIDKISTERIRDELIKILSSEYPADGIKLLHNAGLLDYILPEMTAGIGVTQKGTHHTDDVFDHSLNALRFCKNPNWAVRFATLLHDVGKPVTYRDQNEKSTFYNHDTVGAHLAKDISNRLHLSRVDRDKIFTLVRYHMFSVSEFLTDSAVRRFIRRVGPENTQDMLDLRTADRLGSGTPETSWRHEEFKNRIIEVQKHIPSVQDLKVDGKDVMKVLGIPPGPRVGEILSKLFEEIMEDPSKNEREYLLQRIKALGS